MAKLIVNRDTFKVAELEVTQGTLTLGRGAENDLRIDDLAVSHKHAKIVTFFGSSYVEDLSSTNGTFINGKKINAHTLRNGDVLTVGHYQILFQGATPLNPHLDNDATSMMNAADVAALVAKARSQTTDAPPAATPPLSQPPRQPAQAAPQAQAAPAPVVPPPAPVQPAAAPARLAPSDSSIVRLEDAVRKTTALPTDADTLDAGHAYPAHQNHGRAPAALHLRASDVSTKSSLKVIVLAALAAAITTFLILLVMQ